MLLSEDQSETCLIAVDAHVLVRNSNEVCASL